MKSLQLFADPLTVEPGPFVVQRRVAWAEGSEFRETKLNILKTVHGELEIIKEELQTCYSAFAIWIALLSTIVLPMYIINVLQSGSFSGLIYFINTLSNLFFMVFFVAIQFVYSKERQSSEENLTLLFSKRPRDEMNCDAGHMMLRHLHCAEPYTSFLFDLDLCLLVVIFDTTLLIVLIFLSKAH